MLGYFENWNILQLSPEATSCEEIDKINQFILDSISNDMAELLQTGKYGIIDTTEKTTMGYYVIKFMSEAYTLK